jgi:hypothetical protein
LAREEAFGAAGSQRLGRTETNTCGSGRLKAICQACGVVKGGPFVPCRTCGHVPVGDERPLAWLLSDHHLGVEEIEQAARRIRSGEMLEPPRELLRKALKQMRAAMPSGRRLPWETGDEAAADHPTAYGPNADTSVPAPDWRPQERAWPGLLDPDGPPGGRLSRRQTEWLFALNILLTPLVGGVLWWTWRPVCPRAARQVLWVTVPVAVSMTAIWAVVVIWGWSAAPQ